MGLCSITLLYDSSHFDIIEDTDRHEREKSPADELTKKNITKIRGKFSWLVVQISRKLQQAQVRIEDFRLFLTTFFSPTLKDASAVIGELEKATNFSTLFQVLTTHGMWGYENYYFLESVIELYVPDLRKDMKGYLEHLEGFRLATKLEHYIAALEMLPNPESPDPEMFSRMVTKLQVKPSERTLKYIDDLWESLSIHFNLPPYQLLLEKVLKGCVTITWCFPRYETMRITEMVKSSVQFFSEHDIVEVLINGEIFYQAKADTQLEVRRKPP